MSDSIKISLEAVSNSLDTVINKANNLPADNAEIKLSV